MDNTNGDSCITRDSRRPSCQEESIKHYTKKIKGSLRNNHKIVKEPARKTTKSNSKFYEKYLIQDNAKKRVRRLLLYVFQEILEDIIFLDVDQLYGIVGAGLCLIFILKIFQKQ
eukprot:snap_masked-scaffold_87-processed-gene-0.21-mRNA-1 protein AED:1.00 eAED:1.00 QI:0/0/0/0/1/1/4/0/113